MKCSLLTLSTFIDGELAPQRRAEVDAHLIGCTRCGAGAATLREEKARVGHLARVTVDPESAQLMLEQVGIAVVDPGAELAPPPPTPAPLPDEDRRPWQRGTSSAALPWTPRRPDRLPVGDVPIAPVDVPDGQPELPLEGVRSVPRSWNRPATADPPHPAPVDEIVSSRETEEAETTGWTGTDVEPATGGVPESWEADLPPPADPAPHHVTSWSASTALPPVEPVAPPPPPAAPDLPLVVGPPTRVSAASGPAALWGRIRDAVSVRLALSRGGDALDDSAQIVSGAPARRGELLPPPEAAAPGIAAESSNWQAPPAMVPSELEQSGAGDTQVPVVPEAPAPSLSPVAEERAERLRRASADADATPSRDQATGSAAWNAFAASSYPEIDVAPGPVADEPRPRPQPLGRHSRAVAREQVPLSTRVGRVAATGVGALRVGAGAATARLRQGVGRVGKGGPDSRLLAGIAAVGLVFVVALIVGRGSPRTATPTSTRPAPATSQPQAHQSAPAKSSAAASTSTAPAPAAVQTYGAGDTGFQVVRLRYGVHPGYVRVVFDLGAASGGAAGTPRVTVSFSSPTTLLVTLNGTLPAGSTGTPPPGSVISSVSLASGGGRNTVYRLVLTRAATTTAFFNSSKSPTGFVVDIH